MAAVKIILTAIILIPAMVFDRKLGKIPNSLVFPGMLSGILMTMAESDPEGYQNLVWGMIIPFILLWIPFRMHGIGAGDLKLFLVIGCLNGGTDVFLSICYSILLAAGFSLILLVSSGQLLKSLSLCMEIMRQFFTQHTIPSCNQMSESLHRIHMAVFLSMGYGICLGVKLFRMLPF